MRKPHYALDYSLQKERARRIRDRFFLLSIIALETFFLIKDVLR